MTDRDRRHLRGPVHTMRRETAEWDAATESWKDLEGYELFTFRADGNASGTESHYPKQTSYTAYRYDTGGRLTEIEWWIDAGPKTRTQFHYDGSGRPVETFSVAADGTRQQAETYAYGSEGRKTRVQFLAFACLPDDDVADESQAWQRFIPSGGYDGSSPSPPLTVIYTVIYDTANRPMEVLVHNTSHELQYRVTFTRDREGRMLTGETTFAGIGALGPGLEQALEKASPDERAQMQDALETAFEKQTFLSMSFSYDSSGRLIEKVHRMGTLMEEVTTYRYDERGALVEQTSVNRTHGIKGNGKGPVPTEDQRRDHGSRFEYKYDADGNWTERVATGHSSDTPDVQRSTVERRTFTYYSR